MILELNGKRVEVHDNITLSGLLDFLGVKALGTACEVNGKVLPSSEYSGYHCAPEDRIVLVRLVGGG